MFDPRDVSRADASRLLILHPNPLQYEEALAAKARTCLEHGSRVAFFSNRPRRFLSHCKTKMPTAKGRTPAGLVIHTGGDLRCYRAPKLGDPQNAYRIRPAFDYIFIANASVISGTWFRNLSIHTAVENPKTKIIVSGKPDNMLLAEAQRASALDMAVFAGGYELICSTN